MQAQNNYGRIGLGRESESFSTVERPIAPVEDTLAMAGEERPRLFRFGLAIAGFLSVAAVRWSLGSVLGDRAAYMPFALVILASVLFCGRFPALVAATLSIFFGLYFSGPSDSSVGHVVEAVTFAVTAGGIIALGELVNRLRRKTRQSDRETSEIAEELNLLIDGARGQAIYMLDPEGRVTIWNKGAERLKGWTEAEALGKPSSLFYPPEAVAAGKPEADLARTRDEGRFDEEDWCLRKDGREFLASVSMTALVDESGALRGFAKVISDVTERRAAEDNIRSRESHLSSILSTVPDAMVVIDDAGSILSFSAAASVLFGYSEDDVIGHNVSMLMPSPDRERHDGYIRRYLETGERRIIGRGRVVFAARKDGTSFPMELSIGEANGGTQRIFTGFIRDLTERRRTEERLEHLQSELIHVSRVSAMGSMASTLAHELNQPIGAIANYVEAVRDRLEAPDPGEFAMLRQALDDAAKDALRAGQIVRRLREFVARGEVDRTVEPLPALINDASVLGLIGAGERGIEASFDLAPYASPVFVDRVQIQQVLINLIRNACEAMADSAERKLVIASRHDKPGFARVSVSDSGPGIAREVADHLFTAFITTKQDGMGLGLSICRTIIEANDGRIWMEARAGGGTSFHFTLPLAQTEETHD